MDSYIYKVVVRNAKGKKLDSFHIVSCDILEASTIATYYTFGSGSYPNDAQISKIKRVRKIKSVLNASPIEALVNPEPNRSTGENPQNNTHYPGEEGFNPAGGELMKFKHPKCEEKIEVYDNGWESMRCPKCDGLIERKNLRNVLGLWVFSE